MVRRTLGLVGCAASLAVVTACREDDAASGADAGAGLTQAGSGGSGNEATSGTGAATSSAETMSGTTSGSEESAGLGDGPIKFDVGSIPDAPEGSFCGAPLPVTCDEMDDDPWHAMGLNCPGGSQVSASYNGHPDAVAVHTGNLGTHEPAPYAPREGQKVAILSTGVAANLAIPGSDFYVDHSGHDPGSMLPPPLTPNAVSPTETCADNPALVGTGDCSNTIYEQWIQGNDGNDYAELRMSTMVPVGTSGLSFDFAFFSYEYPAYYKSQYNDMFVAWLESEQWTGNISFDEAGHPISLNAGFLDYKDAPNVHDCPDCTAPELDGTGVDGHAATKWLTTQAPVTAGEQIELIFAIFDLSDGSLDSAIILDNFLWNCEGGPPITIPG